MPTITTRDGTEIFYKDWGKGQPIVFHHGWPLSADEWDASMMYFLQRGYRIPVYIFPAARRNHATMRLILNATHTDEHIEGFLDLMREFRDEYFELPGGRHRFGRRPSRDATFLNRPATAGSLTLGGSVTHHADAAPHCS